MTKDRIRIRCRLQYGAIRTSLLTVLIAAVVCIPLRGQSTEAPCSSDPAFDWLDFWVGEWDVFVEGEEVGENRIQKILNGCAISEEWTDARGRHGYSLFYFQPVSKTWKQVWITDRALARGGVKEKELIARFPDGSVRFQGEVPLNSSESYLDRTSLRLVF